MTNPEGAWTAPIKPDHEAVSTSRRHRLRRAPAQHVRPKALRPLGLRADTDSDPASLRSAIDLIRAPGWLSSGWDGGRAGWIQRVPAGWGRTLFGLVGALTGQFQGRDPDRNGDGWLMIDITADPAGSGSIIEVRGELDQGMEEALGRKLLELDATVVSRWDPTEPVDDLLPGIV